MVPVVRHAIETLRAAGENYDQLILLQPPTPLRRPFHIDEAVVRYHRTGADSLVSVCQSRQPRWTETGGSARRLTTDAEFVEVGAVYIVDVDRFRSEMDLQAGEPVLYEMDPRYHLDIDTEEELRLADIILSANRV